MLMTPDAIASGAHLTFRKRNGSPSPETFSTRVHQLLNVLNGVAHSNHVAAAALFTREPLNRLRGLARPGSIRATIADDGS
jgi:hypothetical protein